LLLQQAVEAVLVVVDQIMVLVSVVQVVEVVVVQLHLKFL
jgi:hypothetical protein